RETRSRDRGVRRNALARSEESASAFRRGETGGEKGKGEEAERRGTGTVRRSGARGGQSWRSRILRNFVFLTRTASGMGAVFCVRRLRVVDLRRRKIGWKLVGRGWFGEFRRLWHFRWKEIGEKELAMGRNKEAEIHTKVESLAGKRIVVSGGTTGIGKATAV